MSPPHPPRTALLSGASRGIGAAIARRLSASGWSLSLGMRTPALPAGLTADRTQITPYDAQEKAEARWVEAARGRFGCIDAVICCAGVMQPASVIDIDDAGLDRMWEVNVKAPRRLIAAAWPALCESGRGRVIVVASMSGVRVRSAESAPYAMTKHAAVALVHGVRQAGWDAGVRATAVCPGYVATDMTRDVTTLPRERMTQAEDVARLVELALDTPNNACLAELHVTCQLEDRD